MREWIVFIFSVNKRLDRLCAILDRRIERRAANVSLPIDRVVDEIYRMNDFKIRLINLRVLVGYIEKRLTKTELIDVRAAAGLMPEQSQNCSRATFYRRRIRALNKACGFAAELGYTQESLEDDFPSYVALVRRFSARRR